MHLQYLAKKEVHIVLGFLSLVSICSSEDTCTAKLAVRKYLFGYDHHEGFELYASRREFLWNPNANGTGIWREDDMCCKADPTLIGGKGYKSVDNDSGNPYYPCGSTCTDKSLPCWIKCCHPDPVIPHHTPPPTSNESWLLGLAGTSTGLLLVSVLYILYSKFCTHSKASASDEEKEGCCPTGLTTDAGRPVENDSYGERLLSSSKTSLNYNPVNADYETRADYGGDQS